MQDLAECVAAVILGAGHATSNGSTANMNLGGKDSLVQRNWVNAGSGGCLVGL